MNDEEIDGLLASMARVSDRDVVLAPLGPAANQLRGDIMKTPTIVGSSESDVTVRARRHLPRRTTRVTLAATALAVLLTGTAAAAVVLQARTGWFGGGAGTEDGAGEFIRLDAPGAAEIVDEIGSEIPLPPGGDFSRLKSTFLRPDADGRGVQMTESGIENVLSYDAACQWTAHWLDGYYRGDAAQKQRALAVLEEIPTWHAIVSSDGGGVVAQLRTRAAGARDDDPERFMQDYQINCTSQISPTGS
ncbi:MAG: hypothetical protein LC749_05975 [Actinobacteria bacterium]|nr:hypothetical protein [Actinomycetota bacterium]